MSKLEFMKSLKRALHSLPDYELKEILQDYEEHFRYGLEEGKSELEIIEGLGDPEQIANEILGADEIFTETEEIIVEPAAAVESYEPKPTNLVRSFWVLIGMGFFNLVFVLGPAIGVAAVIFSGWVVGAAFVASPLLAVAAAILGHASPIMFNIFASIALAGIGGLILLVMSPITKFSWKCVRKYVDFNLKLVKGGQ